MPDSAFAKEDPIIATDINQLVAIPSDAQIQKDRDRLDTSAVIPGQIPTEAQAFEMQRDEILIMLLNNLKDKKEADIIGPVSSFKLFVSGHVGTFFSELSFEELARQRDSLRGVTRNLKETLKLKAAPTDRESAAIEKNIPDVDAFFGNQSEAIARFGQKVIEAKVLAKSQRRLFLSFPKKTTEPALKTLAKMNALREFIDKLGPVVSNVEEYRKLPLGKLAYDIRKNRMVQRLPLSDEDPSKLPIFGQEKEK